MRITNNMLITGMLHNVNNNLLKMSEYQDELATGKKIQSPSDDPVGISKVLKYKTDLSELEQYQTNTRDALSWLETTEIALIDMNEALQRVRELTVQASNGSNTSDDLEKIKNEVEQIKNHMISAANTSYAGRYIFSSYHTDEKLINEDGTFNINITNHEILNKPTTRYEIGIGDTMDISTNGLELFGAVELDNLLNTALPDASVVQLSGAVDLTADYTVKQAVHMGQFNLSGDYTGDNLDLTMSIEGTAYTFLVDESVLDGSGTPLTEQFVKDAFSNATTAGGDALSKFAEVQFDTSGNLIITSLRHDDDVNISGGSTLFAHQSLTATVDPSTNYTAGHDFDISINIGGVVSTFNVNQAAFDGTLDNDGVLQEFKNASDGGTALSSVADVYYNENGKLVITPNTQASNVNTSVAGSTAFDSPLNIGKGKDESKWDITIGDRTFNIDERLLNGSVTPLTEDQFIDILNASEAYEPFTGTLGDAADISIDDSGKLIVKSKASGANIEISGNPSILVKETLVEATRQESIGASKAKMIGKFTNTNNYIVKKATQIGSVNFDGNYTADNLDITIDVSGTSYTFNVDESTLDGSFTQLTEQQFVDAFLNATSGGNALSDFAEVEFNDDGYLVIETKTHGEDVTIDGATSMFSHRSLIATLNPATNYTAGHDFDITLSINGSPAVYNVDESLFDGSLTQDQVINILENSTSPTSGELKSVADIYYDSSNNLVISAKSQRPNINISVGGSAIFSAPTNVGKGLESNNLDITINGVKYDVDESNLDGSITALENNDIADLFSNAKAYQPNTGTLSEVADVYFDKAGNLVIQAKTFGDTIPILGGASVFNTSAIKGPVSLTTNYSVQTLDITINGQVFNVDEVQFDGSGTPLTQDGIIENLEKSSDGTNRLVDVADIYFNSLGELIISAKNPDANTEINFDSSNTIFNSGTAMNIGRETQEIELVSGGYINDETVSSSTDEQSFVVTFDGETQSIKINTSAYSTVTELVTGLQSEIDKAFPPGGDIEVSTMGEANQQALVFKTVDSPQDGTVRSLDIRAVRSEKSQMIKDFEDLITAMDVGDASQLEGYITKIQSHLDNVNTVRSDIGGKTNRMTLVLNRIGDDNINYTKLLSNAEDVDMSEVIMKLKNAENVYQASLSAGARVIQPTLVDFLR